MSSQGYIVFITV